MSKTKYIPTMKGYKATNAQMQCTPNGKIFQFELDKWYEHEGEIKECESGFHFCPQPSGVWSYYSAAGTRVFEIEAQEVLDKPFEPGAAVKRVARRIKFLREIEIDGTGNTGTGNTGNSNTGNSNTGNSNTGTSNTGNSNTGNRNTGNSNTGNRNTGNSNTGNSNTGTGNTGNSNTGNRNTGNSNTGNRNTGWGNTGWSNTGNRNTGNSNTGNSNTGWGNTGWGNTGNSNTGWGNATNHSSGFFCVQEPKVISFDEQTKLTRDEFTKQFPEYWQLCEALQDEGEIDFDDYKRIPGITRKKLKALHAAHLTAKREVRGA